jgi:dihydrolipoamide dehydrogenase
MGFDIPKVSLDMKKLNAWKQGVCNKMSSGVGQLLKGHGVTTIMGHAQWKSSHALEVTNFSSDEKETIESEYFIVATGSRPIEISGFTFDETHILSSTGALNLETLPKSLAVIGGGYIGLEIAGYLATLGVQVTVIEAGQECLSGVVDPECARVVIKNLTQKGVQFLTKTQAQGYQKKDGSLIVKTLSEKGEAGKVLCEKVLVTVGRKPNSDQMNFSEVGIQLTEKEFIKVDSQCRTTQNHIFAIGDIIGQPMLAHKASYEGILAAEVIKGEPRVMDVKTIPSVVFTDPEIASAGLLESEARLKGYDVLVGQFPFAANGRAVSMMETQGFVKMVADKKNHILLGVQIVGPEASNLISEAVLAIEMAARLEDFALTIHPHPTLGETLMEAAEVTLGHPIHIIPKSRSKK